MKKSLVGIIAAVVLLALIVTGVVMGVSGDNSEEIIFTDTFTETMQVENGQALTKQLQKEFTINRCGKYILNADWKPDKEGLLVGCTITNEEGKTVFASTADWCTMSSAPLRMEDGTYTLTLHFLTSKEQWYAFWYDYLINSDKDNSDFVATDVEYTFATDGEFSIPFSIAIEKQSMEYMIGFLVGFGVVFIVTGVIIIIILKTSKKDGSIKCKYDERQELMRGRGFKYAFFTLLIYNLITPMSSIFEIELPADNYALFFIGAVIGILVYVIYAIWNEAYFSLNEKPKNMMTMLALVGVINLAIGVMHIFDGTILTNGKLSINSLNLLLSIAFVIIFIALALKQVVKKREED